MEPATCLNCNTDEHTSADCMEYSKDLPGTYEALGHVLGRVVDQKNDAYGNSWANAAKMLGLLFPQGIAPHQYKDAAVFVRIFDKLARIARDNGGAEDARQDLAGYSLLLWAGS